MTNNKAKDILRVEYLGENYDMREAKNIAVRAIEKIEKLEALKENLIKDWSKCELDMGAEYVIEYINNFLNN